MLNEIKVPRCFTAKDRKPVGYEIHGFSDASEKAYGAVVYVRTEYADGEIDVCVKDKGGTPQKTIHSSIRTLGSMPSFQVGQIYSSQFPVSCHKLRYLPLGRLLHSTVLD